MTGSARAAQPTPPRKPARTEGGQPCFCAHARQHHLEDRGACAECDCRSYRQRPCICGHRPEAHAGECAECSCKAYKSDRTPERMLRAQLRSGRWGIESLPALEDLMRPAPAGEDDDLETRVWACVQKHLIEPRERENPYRKNVRLCVTRGKNGKARPLAPVDIVRKLNALDLIGRVTDKSVRKKLRRLEQRGRVRVVGETHGRVRILGYLQPLKCGRKKPDIDDRKGKPSEGVNTDPLMHESPYVSNNLREAVISQIRGVLVKTLRKALRKELEGQEGVNTDPLKDVDSAIAEIVEGVTIAYIKLAEGVTKGPAYKEDSITPVLSLVEKSSAEEDGLPCIEKTPPTNEPAAAARESGEPEPPRVRSLGMDLVKLSGKVKKWLVGKFKLPTPPTKDLLFELAKWLRDDAGFEQFKLAAEHGRPKNWKYFLPIAKACAEHRPAYEKAAAAGAGAGPSAAALEFARRYEEKVRNGLA